MNELFPVEEVLSPRLQWLKDNCISVIDNGSYFEPGAECPETGATIHRYCAHPYPAGTKLFDERVTGWGDTEYEAIVAVAKKLSLRLWNEPPTPAKA